MYAAENHNLCESRLTTNELAALMLPPTWWEVAYENTERTPSPMALSRGDNGITLYPDGHAGNNDPHRRAFWHPGIGAWQLDDRGIGTDLSIKRFNTKDGAIRVAEDISERYCSNQSLADLYYPRWYGCELGGVRCIETFNQINNPDGPPFVEDGDPIQSDGGAQPRDCRFSGESAIFPCVYINPAFAQGFTGAEDGNPYGWVSFPNATPPLAMPFYVYEQEEEDQFEWRYWMTEDTGFGTDYAARRTYGTWSKHDLDWSLSAEVEGVALCDVTMNRGACPSASALSQLKHDGSALGVGSSVNQGSVILRATLNSNRGKPIRVEFEVRKTPEVFTGAANYIGPFGSSGSRSKCVAGLTVGQYRWQARAVEENGATGPWTSFGNNSDSAPDFVVAQANSCVVCTAGVSLVGAELETTGECGSEPLSATLSASPSSGGVPLNNVSLTGAAGGTATGPINYTFYCNRSDNGVNITPGFAAQYPGISTNPKTAVGICDYVSPNTYTAKVIIQRGSETAEARRTITVGASSILVPEVTTLAVTGLTQASVTFNATVHPQNSTTTYWFDYGTTTSTSQSTASQTLAAATSQSAVSISQGGLSCGQQYYYRVRATNAGGSATPGDVLSFTTDTCGSGGPGTIQLVADPSFEAGDGSWWVSNGDFYIDDEFNNPHTGDFYAYLSNPDGSRGNNLSGGIISPPITIPQNASDADIRIWYSITSDETTTTTIFDKVDVYLIRPPNQLNLITTISNLDENGTSYDRESQDLSSSFYGDTVQIFFAGSTDGSLPTVFRIDDVTLEVDVPSGSAPTVTTGVADQITASSARLNMTVYPNGGTTIVWFELEAEDTSPNDETEHLSVGSGSQSEDVSISVFNLDCDTHYYFRANAQNEHGSDQGASVRSFTTLACAGGAPNADTDPAEKITETSATLTADVDPNGLLTQAWFEWGDTPSLGQETPHFSVGSGTGNIDFSQTISGLSCGTTYYFENHAQNSAGHDDGTTLSFDTVSCATPLAAAFSVSSISGTIPFTVSFLDASQGDPTNWLWSFGDGTSSTSQNPSHVYQNPGIYTVRLRVSNTSSSSVEFRTGLIRVVAPVQATLPHDVNLSRNWSALPLGVGRIVGPEPSEDFGTSLAAGDITGSDSPSLAVGAPLGDPLGRFNAGALTLVPTSRIPGPVEIIDLADGQNTGILGRKTRDQFGGSIATGDLNGDGISDLAVGAHYADPTITIDQGEVLIIYGVSNLTNLGTINLATPPPALRMTSVRGDDFGENFGESIAIGDVTGDGIQDLIIGSSSANPPSGLANSGEIFVLHGHANLSSTPTIELSTLGDFGSLEVTWIAGEYEHGWFGRDVAVADTNGDGILDIISAAHGASPLGRPNAGVGYILYGSESWPDIDQFYLNSGSTAITTTRIYGTLRSFNAGIRVAGGDVNGDGFDDAIIQPWNEWNPSQTSSLISWIVLGRWDLDQQNVIDFQADPFGFAYIYVSEPSEQLRNDLVVGDVTGDGIDDIVAGYATFPAFQSKVAIVLGNAQIDLGWSIPVNSGIPGWTSVISAEEFLYGFGRSAAVCDLDRDGIGEIAIGSNRLSSPNTPFEGTEGSVFVLYPASRPAAGLIFADDFEMGNFSAWTSAIP
jgi:hypothetical protein